ncbi:MAG: ABC transporter ATP-binding protein [Syntrophomonas sp.]
MLDIKLKKSLRDFNLDVSFSVAHEILAIVGPSGCGKTMTLKCIAGLCQPDEGQVALDNTMLFDSKNKVNLPPRQREVGFVFQNYALFPHMNVADNIAFGIRHLNKEEVGERVNALLQKMHLGEYGQRYPGNLSGGQQQRVAIARALAMEPKVLLLDEPFSALDSIVKESLQDELLELQNFFAGHVILVTHNLAEAYKLSSKIAVYEAGQVLQWGDKQAVIERPANTRVARLTGMKNIFNAVVKEPGDQYVMVYISELDGLFRINNQNPSPLLKGQQIGVGIRPENIRIAGGPGENTLAARLSRMHDEISARVCYFSPVRTGAMQPQLEARVPRPGDEELKIGENYCLYLPPQNFFLITRRKV